MSISIFWDTQTKHRLNIAMPSDFVSKFANAFGELPYNLDTEDIPILKGMQAADIKDNYGIYFELIDTIERLGEIHLWSEC